MLFKKNISVITVASALFALIKVFKPFPDCITCCGICAHSCSLTCYTYVSSKLYPFSLDPSIITLYITNVLPALLATLRDLSVNLTSRLKVIFTVSGTKIWSLEPCGISISIC